MEIRVPDQDRVRTQVSNRAVMLASGLKDDYRRICANR
jgi:hypothetical protein